MDGGEKQPIFAQAIKNGFLSAQQITQAVASKAKEKVRPLFVDVLKPAVNWLRERWRVIRPARVGLVLSIVVSLFLGFNAQAKDLLRVIALDHGWEADHWVLCGGLILYATTAWYFSRAFLYPVYTFTPKDRETRFIRWQKYMPRIVGALPVFVLASAFVNVSTAHVIFYLLVGVLFLWALKLRRTFLLKRHASDKETEQENSARLLAAYFPQELPILSVVMVSTITLIAIAVFVANLLMPVSFPTLFGTLGVMFLGAAGLLVMLNLLTFWSDYHELPSLIFLLFLLAIGAGLFNDNHGVRTMVAEPGANDATQAVERDADNRKPADERDAYDRKTLTDHFAEWMNNRLESYNSSGRYPVFVVAAEGGGIRAAYWTAAILTRLQRQHPDFPCHLFAISGVSGGSLGGSAFVADLANAYRAGQFRCTKTETSRHEDGETPWQNKPIDSTALAFLGEDFLAPTVAGLLFPDLISRVNLFCPWLFCFPDRASYLEKAWEKNWFEHNKAAPVQFSGNFLELWGKEGELEIPSLVLNGAWVEDGTRNVTSNVKPRAEKLAEVDDMLANFDKPIALSTAVHMSARFTYVSPAGTVHTKSGETKRVVDGGYFENSGALSARQILEILRETCAEGEELKSVKCNEKVDFYGIIISNNPNSPHAAQAAELARILPNQPQDGPKEEEAGINLSESSNHEPSVNADWFPVLSETLSPVFALYHARTARGSLSEVELVAALGEANALRFQLLNPPGKGNGIPLGWVLSKQIQRNIQKQAESRVAEYAKKLQATGL